MPYFHDHPGIQLDLEILDRDFISARQEAKIAAAQILAREGWSLEDIAAALSISKYNSTTTTAVALAIHSRRNNLINRQPQAPG